MLIGTVFTHVLLLGFIALMVSESHTPGIILFGACYVCVCYSTAQTFVRGRIHEVYLVSDRTLAVLHPRREIRILKPIHLSRFRPVSNIFIVGDGSKFQFFPSTDITESLIVRWFGENQLSACCTAAPEGCRLPKSLRIPFVLLAARIYIANRYAEVIEEEGGDWLITPYVPEGSTHSYWAYVCRLDTERSGITWRGFRNAFIENGGDGLYSAWRPVHLEPVFRELAFYARPEQAPNFDPRYKGNVKSYQVGDCPVCEAVQPYLCQFKTSMQTLERVETQVAALRKTIRQVSTR